MTDSVMKRVREQHRQSSPTKQGITAVCHETVGGRPCRCRRGVVSRHVSCRYAVQQQGRACNMYAQQQGRAESAPCAAHSFPLALVAPLVCAGKAVLLAPPVHVTRQRQLALPLCRGAPCTRAPPQSTSGTSRVGRARRKTPTSSTASSPLAAPSSPQPPSIPPRPLWCR